MVAISSRLRWHTSSIGNMAAKSRTAVRGSGRVGAVIGDNSDGDLVSATRVDGHNSGVPRLAEAAPR